MKTFIKYTVSMIAMLWTVQAFAGQGGHSSEAGMKDHKMNSQYKQHKKFSKQTVKDVQRTLNDKGYTVDVDGVLGTESRNALASFQQDQGLAVKTGELNQETVAALNISTASNSMEQTRQPASINNRESKPKNMDNNMRDDSKTDSNTTYDENY